MNITDRLFAYPVLSNEKNDYKESKFSTDYKYKKGINSVQLVFDIEMNCPEIENLIINGQAEYVIHLECTTTAYREVLHSISKHIEHVIPIGRIHGVLDVVSFIILKKRITTFTCTDWEEDFNGMTFDLFQGSILAYQNLASLNIIKNYEEFTNAGSIFSIYKRVTGEDTPAEILLDSSKIKIGLSSRDYEVYAMYSQPAELQSIFHTMIILPALVYVFEELKIDGGEETYHNKEWFLALEKSYEKRGINFMDEVLDTEKTSYQLAQEAMELPISKALNQIPLLYNNSEEDS